MKAKDLIKSCKSLDEIHKDIERNNTSDQFKLFYPHWINVADETKIRLINDGFKVYNGEWMRGDYGLIIEW